MSQTVAIVTDSTAYPPRAWVEEDKLYVIPNIVIWSNKSYRDGVDLQATEFFERLKVDPVHPTTSVASLGDMKEVYSQAAAAADAVVGIHISSKLSNTYAVAREAVGLLSGKEFHVIDSQTTSMALAMIVRAAAKAAKAGKTAAEVVEVAKAAIPRTGLLLTPETLKYLQRGGRIGAAQAFVGGMLDLKPLLEVRDGAIHPLERVRSRKKAVSRMVDIIAERLTGKTGIRLAAIHAAAEAEATEALNALRDRLGSAVVETVVADVAPTVAVHAGPGTIGIAYGEGF
ncbi:MAG: DegV family protein [Anaerolineales bacterium]|nr:DegV family protein [Anaerolineales bacterium]